MGIGGFLSYLANEWRALLEIYTYSTKFYPASSLTV